MIEVLCSTSSPLPKTLLIPWMEARAPSRIKYLGKSFEMGWIIITRTVVRVQWIHNRSFLLFLFSLFFVHQFSISRLWFPWIHPLTGITHQGLNWDIRFSTDWGLRHIRKSLGMKQWLRIYSLPCVPFPLHPWSLPSVFVNIHGLFLVSKLNLAKYKRRH